MRLLAGLVLVLGLVFAFLQLGAKPPPVPEGKTVAALTFFEAGQVAVSPAWYNFAIPLIGGLGVLVGGNVIAATGR